MRERTLVSSARTWTGRRVDWNPGRSAADFVLTCRQRSKGKTTGDLGFRGPRLPLVGAKPLLALCRRSPSGTRLHASHRDANARQRRPGLIVDGAGKLAESLRVSRRWHAQCGQQDADARDVYAPAAQRRRLRPAASNNHSKPALAIGIRILCHRSNEAR